MSSRRARPPHCASGTFPAEASSQPPPTPTLGGRRTAGSVVDTGADNAQAVVRLSLVRYILNVLILDLGVFRRESGVRIEDDVHAAPILHLPNGPAGGSITESPPIEARALEGVHVRG